MKGPSGQGFPSLKEVQGNPIRASKRKAVKVDLALDLSSSCVGWAAGAGRKLERYGKFVFVEGRGIGEKLVGFEEYFEVLLQVLAPNRLFIERPHTKGATASRHNELLGIVRKVWYQFSETEVETGWIIAPRTIKSLLEVESGGNYDENKKIMVARINELYDLGLRWDRHSKYKSDDDVADAIAVLTASWRREDAE